MKTSLSSFGSVGIEQLLQALFELFAPLAQRLRFFFGQRVHLRIVAIGEQRVVGGDGGKKTRVGAICLDGLDELGALARQRRIALLIERAACISQRRIDLIEALGHLFQTVVYGAHGVCCGGNRTTNACAKKSASASRLIAVNDNHVPTETFTRLSVIWVHGA